MTAFWAECIGTAILIIMGNGVVANVCLQRTYGNQSGWIVITFGWSIAVFIGVLVAAPHSGAHLNPAVSLAMAMLGKISWGLAVNYMIAQLMGAMIGATMVYLVYRDHYNATTDRGAKLATFCTAPAIKNPINNLLMEAVGTFVLIFAVLHMVSPDYKLGALDALPVALTVLGIGLSLGGATGYAINPARDLGPRIMHALLPIADKKDSEWSYSWVPILGPVLGAIASAGLYGLLH
ncbi:MAG: MIP/aquaporin family protein [Saprospiraceae bacterium]|nr:MIP/aquaporin family protein [Saprospiraceae bacterium]